MSRGSPPCAIRIRMSRRVWQGAIVDYVRLVDRKDRIAGLVRLIRDEAVAIERDQFWRRPDNRLDYFSPFRFVSRASAPFRPPEASLLDIEDEAVERPRENTTQRSFVVPRPIPQAFSISRYGPAGKVKLAQVGRKPKLPASLCGLEFILAVRVGGGPPLDTVAPGVHAASTKLSTTRFWPALSNSTVSLLPSTAATVPGPNFWWKTRSPREKRASPPMTLLAMSSPSMVSGWRETRLRGSAASRLAWARCQPGVR